MERSRTTIAALLAVALIPSVALRADVKTEEKSQMKFEGMMGRMMGMFGGKAAKEGLINTVAVKGNRKMTADDYSGEIIDLDEEKVYRLDMRKKSYEVVTFAEMRREMEEAQQKAEKAYKDMPKEEQKAPEQGERQMEIDFSLKESGQKKQINGFDCREVVMTITMREKGKTLEQGGGMVMTSNIWLAPTIEALKEIADFDLRYARKLEGPFAFGAVGLEQMAAALVMYPGMKDMLGKFENEKVNMDGTEILTVTTMEAVKSPEQMAQERSQAGAEPADITSVRGIGGLLGRKLGGKKAEGDNRPKNRSTIFTMNHELLKATPAVAAPEVAIPSGFKQKK